MYHIDLVYTIVSIVLIFVILKADTTFEVIAYLVLWIGMCIVRNLLK